MKKMPLQGICVISFLLLCFGCHNAKKKYRIDAVDSFTISFHTRHFPDAICQSLEVHDSNFLVCIVPKDSAIIFQSLYPPPNFYKNISLKKTLERINSLPSSLALSNDTIVLCYPDIPEIIFLDMQGNVLGATLFKKTIKKDDLIADRDIPVGFRNGNMYIGRVTQDRRYISYIYPNCDQVYHKDSYGNLTIMGQSGNYPANFASQYIHLNDFFRIFLENSIIYGFRSSDSLFKYDLNGNCIKRAAIASEYGGNFAPFDTNRHGDIPYIQDYCIKAEQNLLFAYSKPDNLLYCVKRIRRENSDNPQKTEKTVLIALDTALNVKYEILLPGRPIKRDILFFRNHSIYSGSYQDAKVIKYDVHES